MRGEYGVERRNVQLMIHESTVYTLHITFHCTAHMNSQVFSVNWEKFGCDKCWDLKQVTGEKRAPSFKFIERMAQYNDGSTHCQVWSELSLIQEGKTLATPGPSVDNFISLGVRLLSTPIDYPKPLLLRGSRGVLPQKLLKR